MHNLLQTHKIRFSTDKNSDTMGLSDPTPYPNYRQPRGFNHGGQAQIPDNKLVTFRRNWLNQHLRLLYMDSRTYGDQ